MRESAMPNARPAVQQLPPTREYGDIAGVRVGYSAQWWESLTFSLPYTTCRPYVPWRVRNLVQQLLLNYYSLSQNV